jgi:hypothetical protein
VAYFPAAQSAQSADESCSLASVPAACLPAAHAEQADWAVSEV